MKQMTLVLGVLSVLGCSQLSHKKKFVTVVLANSSSHALNRVALESGDRELRVGILIPGSDKVLLDEPWSKAPEAATITFLDYNTKQPYKIPVSLADVNAKVYSGEC